MLYGPGGAHFDCEPEETEARTVVEAIEKPDAWKLRMKARQRVSRKRNQPKKMTLEQYLERYDEFMCGVGSGLNVDFLDLRS